jgi:hypothetical protein
MRPKALNPDPSLANERKLKLEPKLTYDITLTAEAMRPKLRKLIQDDNLT